MAYRTHGMTMHQRTLHSSQYLLQTPHYYGTLCNYIKTPQCTASQHTTFTIPDNTALCNTIRPYIIGNAPHNTVTHCATLWHTAPLCSILFHTASNHTTLRHTARYCNMLHHTTPHCTMHHTPPCTTLHHAPHCTMHHTPPCTTLHHAPHCTL